MKSLSQYINKENVFEANVNFDFTSNLNDIEKHFTQKISKLIGKNNNITISIGGIDDIELMPKEIENKSIAYDLRSAAGILVENYIKKLLNTELSSEDYLLSDDKFIDDIENADFGTYTNYDFEIGNIPFEIKTYSEYTNNGIYISKSQKDIGPDAFFILVELAFSQNTIMIKNISVRQYKNIISSGKYITGVRK